MNFVYWKVDAIFLRSFSSGLRSPSIFFQNKSIFLIYWFEKPLISGFGHLNGPNLLILWWNSFSTGMEQVRDAYFKIFEFLG